METWGNAALIAGGCPVVIGSILTLIIYMVRSGQTSPNWKMEMITGRQLDADEVFADLMAGGMPSAARSPSGSLTVATRSGFVPWLGIFGWAAALYAAMGLVMGISGFRPAFPAAVIGAPFALILLGIWWTELRRRRTLHIDGHTVRIVRAGHAVELPREDVVRAGYRAGTAVARLVLWCRADADELRDVFGDVTDVDGDVVVVTVGRAHSVRREDLEALRAVFADRWVIASADGTIHRGRPLPAVDRFDEEEAAVPPDISDEPPEAWDGPAPTSVTIGAPRLALPAAVGALSAVLFALSGSGAALPLPQDAVRMLAYVSAAFAVPWLAIGLRRMLKGHRLRVDETAVHIGRGFRTLTIPRAKIRHVGLLPPEHDPVLALWCTIPAEHIDPAFPATGIGDGVTVIPLEGTSGLSRKRLAVLRRIFADRWALADEHGEVVERAA